MCLIHEKRGFDVSVYERRDDLRLTEITAGKSINLALSVRGWTALKVGAAENVEKIAIPMCEVYTIQRGTLRSLMEILDKLFTRYLEQI